MVHFFDKFMIQPKLNIDFWILNWMVQPTPNIDYLNASTFFGYKLNL